MLRSPHRSGCNGFARLVCGGWIAKSGDIGGVIFATELALVYSMQSSIMHIVNQWSEALCLLHFL